MANLQRITSILDAGTGVVLYSPAEITGWDTSFSCPSSVITIPGVSGGLNMRGSLPNPMAPRTATLKFRHRFGGAGDRETVRDAIVGALRGKELNLIATQPDGSQRQYYAQLTDFDDNRGPESQFDPEFTIKFALTRSTAKALFPANVPRADAGFHFDAGFSFDVGAILNLTAASQTITITNGGNAYDYEPRFEIHGPFDGPITVMNFSDPIGGSYANFTYAGSLVSGDVLVVDVGLELVFKNLAAGGTIFDFGNFSWGAGVAQRFWSRLLPGSNVVGVSHVGGSVGGFMVPRSFDTWE